MVNRPPPKSGGPKAANSDASSGREIGLNGTSGGNHSNGSIRRGLEWSLRSLQSIDTGAQHFLQNYYADDSDGEDSDSSTEVLADQTAHEIFKTHIHGAQRRKEAVWAALHAPLRTGVVDGRKVVFELLTNVTERPETSRKERLARRHFHKNADLSTWDVRMRLWLLGFRLPKITALFLTAFIAINALFAGLFYANPGKCCGDDDMTFAMVFAFTVQTSTTIGYGSMSPDGMVANFWVVILSFATTLMNTIFAGLIFTKFVTPVMNIQCSTCMTLCNVNGVPCLSVRLGNADGQRNPVTDVNVRLEYSYNIPYKDHKGDEKFFSQTEELTLLSNRRHGLLDVWTLRHVLDESSPLFGLHFEEHPGNRIDVFTLSIDAVQDLTKSPVNVQTEYGVEDILIGHTFVNLATTTNKPLNQSKVAKFTRRIRRLTQRCGSRYNVPTTRVFDFGKLSDTEVYPVWYPSRTGAHGNEKPPTIRSFKP